MPFALIPILTKIMGTLVISLFTEAFVKGVILIVLEKLVKSSSNDLDDKLFGEVKRALGG